MKNEKEKFIAVLTGIYSFALVLQNKLFLSDIPAAAEKLAKDVVEKFDMKAFEED